MSATNDKRIITYLALGDSYTIGEQVRLTDSFPYQAVQLLRKEENAKDLAFYAPEIIAKTGWTTDELLAAIDGYKTLDQYGIVSLLIGVNNQYRGRAVDNFETEFTSLLEKAIGFSATGAAAVYVFSIPDWGVTPFAGGRDGNKIAMEIDDYNEVCERIAKKYKTNYIDITPSQREDAEHAEFVAGDGLHPSGKEYAKWAARFVEKLLPPFGLPTNGF
jgi:lysophospholipase L1-like esterase